MFVSSLFFRLRLRLQAMGTIRSVDVSREKVYQNYFSSRRNIFVGRTTISNGVIKFII